MSQLRDDVLSQTDIVDLVSRYVQLKKVGKNRVGLCPFHKEKTPSFTVAEDKQIFKCFGCGKGGNAITFHIEIERIDFRDSLKLLAQDANIDVAKYQFKPEEYSKKQGQREKIKLINKYTQSFFSEQVGAAPAVQDYLTNQRGLTETTIKQFGLGYAPDSHYELITHLKNKGFAPEDLGEAGLARKGRSGDWYAFFRQRVTFPIHDHIGNIVGFGGRALAADQTPKYLNTTETPLYDKSKILFGLHAAKEQIDQHDLVLIVEGYMDVIALHQSSLAMTVAPCGTSLTQQQLKLLGRYTQRIVFAFDNDHAGFEATLRALKTSYQQDIFPKVFPYPHDYKDIDEYLAASQTELSVETVSSQLIDGYLRAMDQLSQQLDLSNPVERKKFLNQCFDLLASLEDRSVISLYLQQLADHLSTPHQQLKKQFESYIRSSRLSHQQAKRPSGHQQLIANKYLLVGLVYQDYLAARQLDSAHITGLLTLIDELSTHFPESLLAELDQPTAEDQQSLLEAQLRRDQQLDSLPPAKQTSTVTSFLHRQLHALERVVLTSKQLDHQQKSSLLSKLKQIKQHRQ